MKTTLSVGAAGLTVVVLASVAVAISALTPVARADGSASTDEQIAAVSRVFVEEQRDTDLLPKFLTQGDQALPIDPDSSRLLGSIDRATFWGATNFDRQVCLAVLLSGPDEFASVTCQTALVVLSNGLGIQVANEDDAFRAYFLPSGTSVSTSDFDQVGPQLIVGDAYALVDAKSIGAVREGQAVDLTPFQPLERVSK